MIDLLSKNNIINPYPTFNRMRESYPVCEIEPGGIWVFSRYEDVKNGLSNCEQFTSALKKDLFSPQWLPEKCQSDLFIAVIDPPEHRMRRQVIASPFSCGNVRDLIPLMEQTAENLVKKISSQRSVEFIHDFAYKYIGRILGEMTGLGDLQTLQETREWVQATELASSKNLDNVTKDRIIELISRQKNLFSQVIREKRSSPQKDIVSSMVNKKVNGEYLTDNQLTNVIELLIRSGYQSTVHLLANAIIQLVRNQNVFSELLRDQTLIPTFVEELLRLYSPIPMAIRHTTKEVTLHDVTLPVGSQVWMSMAAANRDPRIFSNPDQYDLYRKNANDHLSFGYGHRLCLGLHLARLEMHAAIKHMLPIIPRVSCPSDEELNWIETLLVRVLNELPITLH